MANQKFPVIVTQMHTITFTITEETAIGTLSFLCPFTVTEFTETIFPYIHKIILIDIPLMIITTDTRTGRDRTVCQDRSYAYSGIAGVEMVTYLSLIFSQKAFTSERNMHPTLRIRLINSIKPISSVFVNCNSGD